MAQTRFELLADLPIGDQLEIARIQTISSGLRTTTEANFLTSRAPYITNLVSLTDSGTGYYLHAKGAVLPTSYVGFAKGCLFRLTTDGGRNLYENVGDHLSAIWAKITVDGS